MMMHMSATGKIPAGTRLSLGFPIAPATGSFRALVPTTA